MLTGWRKLVPIEVRDTLRIAESELLDELDNHLDIPLREKTDDNKAVLGRWIEKGLEKRLITVAEHNLLRKRLGLQKDMGEAKEILVTV